jgi:hypothetical protein
MNKDCEDYMDQFLSLDKGERIPLSLTMHLLHCSKCRSEVRALERAERAVGRPINIPAPITDNTITTVMRTIDPAYDPQKNHVPLFQWIIAGVIMIAALFSFGIYTSSSSSHFLLVAFYLMFAGVVTAYSMLFIGTNLDFFVKKINAFKS